MGDLGENSWVVRSLTRFPGRLGWSGRLGEDGWGEFLVVGWGLVGDGGVPADGF
jgi:hypothetical protein